MVKRFESVQSIGLSGICSEWLPAVVDILRSHGWDNIAVSEDGLSVSAHSDGFMFARQASVRLMPSGHGTEASVSVVLTVDNVD